MPSLLVWVIGFEPTTFAPHKCISHTYRGKWTFEPLEEGSSTVLFEYNRPWEGGEKIEYTLTATITIN